MEITSKSYLLLFTTGAFNALLKTLEEPPKHAIFILATTEPHKIPLTVLSRCQRYDFRKINNQVMIDRMSFIVEQEGVQVEREALDVIARVANGGMRDALSLLDQAIAHSDGKVTLEDVIELTGTVDLRLIGEMTQVLVNRDTAKALDLLDEILDSGKEGKFLIDDLLAYFRDVLVYRRIGDKANLTKAVTDVQFKTIAQSLELGRVYDVIEQLSKCQQALKFTGNERISIEVSLMKITSLPTTDDLISLREEVEQLKKIIAGNGTLPIAVTSEVATKTEETAETPLPLQAEVEESADTSSQDPFALLGEIEADLKQESNPSTNELETHVSELNGPVEGGNIEVGEPLDFLSQVENDLNNSTEKTNVHESDLTNSVAEQETTEENQDESLNSVEPLAEDSIAASAPLPFIEQIERDIVNGESYIEVVGDFVPEDESIPPEEQIPLTDEHVPPAETGHADTPKDIVQPVKSDKEDQILEILSHATKDLKQAYFEKHEAVLATLKNDRVATMSLYRDAQVIAVSDKWVVLVYKEKAKTKMLEKVINRSIVKVVLEEVLTRPMDVIAVSEAEWLSIVSAFKNK
ncbi:hypothetical protein [Peribacillus asahii]|uniref:hypothetical protein n=1 Tax=Peribacillus asahii TaxID=228899 RepID=UPI002079DB2A|nr:hypothetical protein [Peribacillus asahii]USK62228.1 hypothetical protein LIT37_23935 [Peribacillus asahii]